jgi:hypothetical protein
MRTQDIESRASAVQPMIIGLNCASVPEVCPNYVGMVPRG